MSSFTVDPFFQKDLKSSLMKSVFLHVLLLALLFALSEIQQFYQDQTLKKNLNLVQSSVRVDMVAMPEKTFQELKAISETNSQSQKAKPTQKTKPEPKSKPKPKPKPKAKPKSKDSSVEFVKKGEGKKQKSENFMQMLQGVSENEGSAAQKKAREESSAIDEQNQQALEDLVLKGNKISKGTSIVGSGSDEASEAFVSYMQKLPTHVRPHWKLPSYLMNKGYQCRIRIYLNESGRLLNAKVYEPSDSQEYNNMAMRAVRNASPFPEPDRSFADRAIKGHIVLGFPL